jgi:ABC-type Fe2+-enterobactin transport system substrate-binding protein
MLDYDTRVLRQAMIVEGYEHIARAIEADTVHLLSPADRDVLEIFKRKIRATSRLTHRDLGYTDPWD